MSDRFTTLQRMGLAVQQDHDHNDAWLDLGNALATDSISVDGSMINRRSCLTTCLENDDYYWRAWYNLGITMDNAETVTVRGRNFGRDDCLVRCLELEESAETAPAWNVLGTSAFHRKTKVQVGGRTYTPAQCFIRALELDDNVADAWLNAALASPAGITLGDRSLTSQQCVVHALQRNRELSRGWYALAVELYSERLTEGTTTPAMVDGVEVGELECEKNALRYDPQLSHAWSLMANTLRDAGHKSVNIGGVEYDHPAAVRKALECDPRCALAWSNLSPLIGTDDNVVVDGETVTAQSATLRALQLMPHNPFAWYNLGVTLTEPTGGADATVGARSYTANECFVEALRHNEKYGRAWLALGQRLLGDEIVVVGGTSYNRYQCIAKGELFGDAPPAPPAESTTPQTEL